ncbi:MAG: helix-turn-helix domain-containing protein, partial [Pseudomonadota bacterium]|nr:helix-turn-helix domain-containing protein [Pseudomonadota bacterium]
NDEEFTNISKKNVVVISGDKKSNLQNQVKIEEYPINIQKLIEIINIQFLKNKFNQQNNVKVGKYYINLNSRVMNLKSKSLQLTEKEVKIISFLNDSDSPISINKLQSEVWGYKSKLETHTVETHVYRLRKKIEKKFRDNSFIVSLKNGYKIKD